MSKDLLAEATRALREAEPVSEFEARATRARVMNGLHQTRVRRRTRLAFLLPIAASFVAVSAWGAASGQARVVLEKLERFVGVAAPSPTPAKVNPRKPAAAPARPVPSQEPTARTPMQDAEPTLPAPVAAPEAVPARASASASASSARAERPDPTLSLYRVAHAAHFVDRDPARALAAWDAYLSAAPSGQFAPEARYNRALSLVRLGRNQEARSALEPFANGAYGAYRKAEASALLERLAP
ncbi:MAG TPA: hypothetical protein VER11_05075 [Polyangiaceae bacterium]|nr:hypothetical protein [Polyangiaceae bacterium]